MCTRGTEPEGRKEERGKEKDGRVKVFQDGIGPGCPAFRLMADVL